MQYPDENVMYESDKENNYGYLMQFEDGNRIDLHVSTLNYVLDKLKGGKLYKVLLDKRLKPFMVIVLLLCGSV